MRAARRAASASARARILVQGECQAQTNSWQLGDWQLLKDLRQKRDDKVERKEVLRYFQIGFRALDDKEKEPDALVALAMRLLEAQKFAETKPPPTSYLPRSHFPKTSEKFLPKPNAAKWLAAEWDNTQSPEFGQLLDAIVLYKTVLAGGHAAAASKAASPLPRREADVERRARLLLLCQDGRGGRGAGASHGMARSRTYVKETNKEKIQGLCVGCVEDCIKGAGHYQKLLTEPTDDQEKQAEKEKRRNGGRNQKCVALTEQFRRRRKSCSNRRSRC